MAKIIVGSSSDASKAKRQSGQGMAWVPWLSGSIVVMALVACQGFSPRHSSYKVTDESSPTDRMSSTTEKAVIPTLSLTQLVHPGHRLDFGAALIGEKSQWHGSFDLHNDSAAEINGVNLVTTCGCTVVSPVNPVMKPGDRQRVQVEIDLTGKKRGLLRKTIRWQYVDHEGKAQDKSAQVTVLLKGDHPVFSAAELQKKIFSPPCASCHVEPSKGKSGEALFVAACAFCHGDKGQGASAVSLTRVSFLMGFNEDHVRQRIAEGLNGMPGFARAKGGPLSDQQIQSLLNYFKKNRDDNRHLWSDDTAEESSAPSH